MRTLIVGAGATGGYLGAKLLSAGRDVTLLVRPRTAARLHAEGIRIRAGDGTIATVPAPVITQQTLRDPFDIVVVAVRGDALSDAMDSTAASVGDRTTIVPLVNGVEHLDLLVARFSADRVCGGVAKLAVSLDGAGVIDEVQPGVTLEIGPLGGAAETTIAAVAGELNVEGVVSTVSDDIVGAMWAKFAFITATTALTCLLHDVIGPIARNRTGAAVAEAILEEIVGICAAEGHPLTTTSSNVLRATLTDADSRFGPSMFRDLLGGRRVEANVLADMAARARRSGVHAPFVGAASVTLALHNQRVAARAGGH